MESQQPLTQQIGTPSPQKSIPSHPHKNKLFIIIGIIVLLILVIGTASAAFLSMNKQKSVQKMATQPPIIKPSSIPTANPTANWKTYTNTQYGFTFQYPSSWTLSGSQLNNQDNSASVFMYFWPNPNNLSLQALNQSLTGASGKGPNLYTPTMKKIQVGGQTAYEIWPCAIDGYAGECRKYLIPWKTSVLEIRYTSSPKNYAMTDFDKMLSTFTFINPPQTPIIKSPFSCKTPRPTGMPNEGMSFVNAFCSGLLNESCSNITTQSVCNTHDVVKVENGMASSGSDGIVDCTWDLPTKTCTPK